MTLPFARLPGRLRLTAAALAGACLIAPYSPSQESTDVAPIIPFPTETRTLPNGLNVIVVPMPSDGLVAYWSIVRTGSRDEYEPGPLGLRAFLRAHDVPRHGALPVRRLQPHHHDDRRRRERLHDRRPHGLSPVDGGRGSRASHGARERSVPTTCRTPKPRSRPRPAPSTASIARRARSPSSRSTRSSSARRSSAIRTATRRSATSATSRSCRRCTSTRATFFSRYYRPDNTVLFIAGDVTPANVFALVEKHYGGWQRGYVPPQIPVEPEQTAERRVDVGYDGQTLPLLQLAYKLPRLRPRRPHARRRGPLRRPRVRRDQRGVSAARARRASRRGPRRRRGVQPRSRLARDLRRASRTRARSTTCSASSTRRSRSSAPTAPDAQRLADLQRRLRYGFLMGLQTPDSRRRRAWRRSSRYHGDLHGLDRLYATYAAITPADVHAAAERYLHSERRTVGVLRSRQ